MKDASPEVKKIILLPREDVKEFEEKYPQHGAFTWFVREALRRFNEINQHDPQELLDAAVGEIEIPTPRQ